MENGRFKYYNKINNMKKYNKKDKLLEEKLKDAKEIGK